MKPFEDLHISEPGLIVIEVAAADEPTALAAIEEIGTRAHLRPVDPLARAGRARRPGARVRRHPDRPSCG
nr:DUF6207 family protein [Streptomyces sp. ISL-10]